MKPDWCDEVTWERAWDMWRDDEYDDGPTLIARALIAARNEGLTEAAQVAHDMPDANNDVRGPLYATGWTSACRTITAAIRSRIQKEQDSLSD